MWLFRWANTHDKPLTVVGAFIIFGSFMAKDVYGERAKELQSSLAATESEFVLYSQLRTLNTKADEVNGYIEYMKARDSATLWHEPVVEPISNDWAIQEAHDQQRQVAVLSFLESRLAEGKGHGCEKPELENLKENLHIALESNNTGVKVTKTMDVVYDCEKRLRKAAEEEVKDAKEQKEFEKNLSYGFFALGWGLTLLGKLSKGKSGGDIEVEV